MAKKMTDVRVNLPGELPDGVEPTLHVYDTHGKLLSKSAISDKGRARVAIPPSLKGAALRYVVAPQSAGEPSLKQLRRLEAVESIRAFDPAEPVAIDVGENVLTAWRLCSCTVRGKVVKAVPQPTGTSVDYPVCYARVHICEVDPILRIVERIPDRFIERVRDDLLVGPLPDPPPFQQRLRKVEGETLELRSGAAPQALTASLQLAPTLYDARQALIDHIALRWWCWFPYLDPFFEYEYDCWHDITDDEGRFEVTITHPCYDTPDIYIWVDQFIAGSWTPIYLRGPRCDTRWNYDCGSEITIRVTHPDAKVCVPPPEIDVPEGISTWVLPMAVGHLEIAGSASPPVGDQLGWVQSDGTASYDGGPANIGPITDAPLGGYLRFKMLHSLDLPKAGMTRYVWSYRPKPTPDPTIAGGWTKMDENVIRKYQVPGPGGFPQYPQYPLGPDADGLYEFRPHTPPAGVWPVSGFVEDLWSAKLATGPLAPGEYQIRVTVHNGGGAVVPPGGGTFQFVVTETRDAAKETFSTRAANGAEIIDDGFVFDVVIDNGQCTSVLYPVQTSTGGVADACGFLRYLDKATTDVILSFEASHPRNEAWFMLDLVRGLTDLDQVEVMNGGLVGAAAVGVDSNGGGVWPNAFYLGDGAGNFSGTFPAQRFLEACDNGAFGVNLWTRAKAHDGEGRLHEYDSFMNMAFALAEEEEV